MIQLYKGEFLVSPIPMELSINYCSHACSYCFANLNNPERQADINQVINYIRNAKKNSSLLAYLIANKFPVLMSNKSDPFSNTNYRQALPLIEILTDNGNGIAFQTKGGKGIDDALEIVDKSAWYVSISYFDDNIRKKIEPAAPSLQERFDLIEKLMKKGHYVSVGINPIVEEWLPYEHYEELLGKLRTLGVKDVWVDVLHLNPKQINNMPSKAAQAIGVDIIDTAKKRKKRKNTKLIYDYYTIAEDMGFNVFSINSPLKSDYFNKYAKIYGEDKVLKTNQEFINHCYDDMKSGEIITFDYFYEYIKKDWYEMEFSGLDGYIYNIGRNIYKRENVKNIKTIKDVIKFFWQIGDIRSSVANNQCFSYICENKITLTDEDHMNYLMFRREADFDGYFTEVKSDGL